MSHPRHAHALNGRGGAAERSFSLKVEKCVKPAFTVIGKEGSTRDGSGFVQRLWEEANAHFGEVEHLAIRNENGKPVGIWGAMSDFSRAFRPWDRDYSEGLYLAGVECACGAEPPSGWTKWTIPGFEYLRFENEGEDSFAEAIRCLRKNGLTLAAAVQDFTCPETGKSYQYVPVKPLE